MTVVVVGSGLAVVVVASGVTVVVVGSVVTVVVVGSGLAVVVVASVVTVVVVGSGLAVVVVASVVVVTAVEKYSLTTAAPSFKYSISPLRKIPYSPVRPPPRLRATATRSSPCSTLMGLRPCRRSFSF